jgi:hypothetical protein
MLSLIPVACAAVVCAAPLPASPAALLSVPVVTAGPGECVPSRTASGATTAAKRTGPLGWLLRYNRDEDELERTRIAAPISYYLRSPLLTSFFANAPCPQGTERVAGGADECAALLVRGRDGDDLLEIGLPQHGATSAARLRAVVSDHQARGEALTFAVAGDGEVEVPANAVREVQTRSCR